MNTNKKQINNKEIFDIQKEIEFWNSYCYNEKSDTELITKFKKLFNEKLSNEDLNIIIDNLVRVIPVENKPLFFLKIYLEIPKKVCKVSQGLIEVIKQFCIEFFEKSNFESEYYASIGKSICLSDKPEIIITKFIEKIQLCVTNNDSYNSTDVFAIAYIWLVQNCKEYRTYDIWKTILTIEKSFVELLRTEEEKDIKDCILKSVPKAIANNTYKKKFLNSSYLYIDDRKKLTELEENNTNLKKTIGILISEKAMQSEKIEILNKKKTELETELSSVNAERERLTDELVSEKNMMNFEINRFEQLYISKKKGLMSEVESVIGLEIEGIEEIAYILPERDKERILRRVRRIREQIIEMGGQS